MQNFEAYLQLVIFYVIQAEAQYRWGQFIVTSLYFISSAYQ